MINIIFWSLLIGLFRALHGSGSASRIWLLLFASIAGITTYSMTIPMSILYVLGLIILWCPGWGKYLSTVGSGTYKPNETEIAFIDVIIKNFPTSSQPIIGMCLRWGVLALPLVVTLSNPWLLGCFAVGGIYWCHRFHKEWLLTEGGSGAFVMFLILAGSL